MKFLGITFDSQLNFKKHFEDILDRCNTRYHCLRLIAKKWGPSPATLIQIYKQCVRPIFEYGSLSTITASDYIISKIQWLQNKFIRLALILPRYICSKLLHDSVSSQRACRNIGLGLVKVLGLSSGWDKAKVQGRRRTTSVSSLEQEDAVWAKN